MSVPCANCLPKIQVLGFTILHWIAGTKWSSEPQIVGQGIESMGCDEAEEEGKTLESKWICLVSGRFSTLWAPAKYAGGAVCKLEDSENSDVRKADRCSKKSNLLQDLGDLPASNPFKPKPDTYSGEDEG